MKKLLAEKWAQLHVLSQQKWMKNPIPFQNQWLKKLVKSAQNTQFGKDHSFQNIQSIEDFQKHVPIKDYEELRPYFDEILQGKPDILWKGKPQYLAKTSGTTSGVKYIPISHASMKFQLHSARSALFFYINRTHDASFVEGKMIFLQGSPVLEDIQGIPTGRLSGIVAHTVPKYLQKNRMPSWATNCIEDWETKVDQIVEETQHQNMTLISGIPPWLIMYFEKLLQASGKNSISELFPHLQLIVTGGVNFEPYRAKMMELIGKPIDIVQTFPASEGFFAFQDKTEEEGLLLLANHGIFYEFVPLEDIHSPNPPRLTLDQVELQKDYALIISTNAGLWAYNIGDTVRFIHRNPYRILVSGRIKHFTSAFGEHVISHDIEKALQQTLERYPAKIIEFTMAPQVNPKEGLPYHEWFIEFDQEPTDIEAFRLELDANVRKQNTYYDDLIEGKILQPLQITQLPKNTFMQFMKEEGKLGGQNKVVRLANDRKIADRLSRYISK